MKLVPDIVVVGTDTGVGKSVTALLLMQMLHAGGYTPLYLKPFQTGCVDPFDMYSDAAFVHRHMNMTSFKKESVTSSIIHCFPTPKAPYFAARDVGRKIDIDSVHQEIDRKRQTHSGPLIVEAAGGLLVPVTKDLFVVDMIPKINCIPLLVARPGLGTINHTLLSVEALHRRNINPLGIVFVETTPIPTDPIMIAENMEAIEKHTGTNVNGVIPFLADFSVPPAQAYHPLENLL